MSENRPTIVPRNCRRHHPQERVNDFVGPLRPKIARHLRESAEIREQYRDLDDLAFLGMQTTARTEVRITVTSANTHRMECMPQKADKRRSTQNALRSKDRIRFLPRGV